MVNFKLILLSSFLEKETFSEKIEGHLSMCTIFWLKETLISVQYFVFWLQIALKRKGGPGRIDFISKIRQEKWLPTEM
jgi:hypothetical protein